MSHAGGIRTAVAAVVGAALALLIAAGPSEAGIAIIIRGSGTVHLGGRVTYLIDYRHAYDPRSRNGIAPGDHVSITLSPPRCGEFCVARRLSRNLFVPRSGTTRFRLRFPREYTVCSRAQAGASTACRRIRWQHGDRGIINVTVHGFSEQCPFGPCRRTGAKSIVVA
jgi:hypothetical protein